MKPIIEVEDLCYCYPNGFQALRGLNLAVYPGEFVAIVGQNGSGKTTFLKHLNGLLRPTSGQVRVDGRDVSKHKVSEMACAVGYCFQNPDHQIFCDTVYAEVAFGPRNLRLSETEVSGRVEEALLAVGLWPLKDRHPKELSKGQRQRVAVAAVLCMQPRVLLIDEPTTGQDYQDGLDILNRIESFQRAGHTVLFITHDMPMVARFAHRVLVFKSGQILLDGPAREVLGHLDVLQATYLDPPQITRLADILRKYYPETVLSVTELLEQTLALCEKQSARALVKTGVIPV
jgi:energy-coupling factor transport system ATP-binding protein